MFVMMVMTTTQSINQKFKWTNAKPLQSLLRQYLHQYCHCIVFYRLRWIKVLLNMGKMGRYYVPGNESFKFMFKCRQCHWWRHFRRKTIPGFFCRRYTKRSVADCLKTDVKVRDWPWQRWTVRPLPRPSLRTRRFRTPPARVLCPGDPPGRCRRARGDRSGSSIVGTTTPSRRRNPSRKPPPSSRPDRQTHTATFNRPNWFSWYRQIAAILNNNIGF